jgi:hypothetical protein
MRKYDDIKPLRILEPVRDFVRDQLIAVLQRRYHGAADDLCSLPDIADNEKGKQKDKCDIQNIGHKALDLVTHDRFLPPAAFPM